MTRLGLRGPFTDPRFRRLLAGQTLSTFGDTALYLTLGIWAKALTHSNSAAGCVFLALGLPALFAPAAGHLADRVRRRPLLLWANGLTAVGVLSLYAVHSAAQLWIIYLVAFGYGVSFSVLGSASAGLQKDLLPAAHLAAANAAMETTGYGVRIIAPLAGGGLFAAFGGRAVALLDVATFAAAIAALSSVRVTESPPEPAPARTWRHEMAAGFRHIRGVPLLAQVTIVTACAFSVIGLSETVTFAVIAQGLHRPPAFLGVLSSVQGAAAIAAGLVMTPLLRRLGTARMTGVALAGFALGALACVTASLPLVLAGAVADGAGLLWLVAVSATAIQRHTPPRLQGRATAAWTAAIITPQTLSIAAGAAAISYASYRTLLLAIVAATGTCAVLLLARPAPEPQEEQKEAAAGPDHPGRETGEHPVAI